VWRIVATRLAAAIPTLFLVLLLSFLLSELIPGDPAATIAGENASPEVIEQVRQSLGLNQAVIPRFVSYVGEIIQGDLGESLTSRRPVSAVIWESIPPTASVVFVALSMALVIGLAAGILAALRRDTWIDRCVSGVAALMLAVPPFVVALVLVVPLAVNRSWLPATGYAELNAGGWEWFRYLLLPSFALAIGSAAELVRQVRGAFVDTLQQDYIVTCVASGLSKWSVVSTHVFKNAASPIVTVFGLQMARIIGAAVVVETVFALPGFGALAFSAVINADIPLIRGVVLVGAVVVIATNVLVDISYPMFNPKLRV
jgi:peptide/nickel transport system permease protein